MVGINLSNSMRFSLLSLKQTEISVEQTQLRLSTGLKVNSALDNPRNYYAANSLMNRAHDLNSLLDSMSQGIQTIKTSLQGLQTGEKLLKQASAVVAQACDVAPVILDKEWFENQKGVIAVVTSADELKSALASNKSGAIVVYGEIDMGNETITVDSGKKLVGVGYYADINSKATDANIEKFSKLTFDLKYDGVTEDRSPITLNSGASLSDLSVYAETDRMGTTYYTAGVIKCKGNNTITNADVSLDLSDAVKLSGLSGFMGILGGTSTVLNGSINIRNFTQGHPDYMIAGVCGGTVSIRGNAQLNISGTMRGITQGKFHVYDRAEINIEPGKNSYVSCGFSYGVVYLHSSESQNSSIISVRQSFTENLINILTEGADKLTLGDMNKEAANMLALQLRQQLAVNSLNLVSQSNQGILQLF